MTKKGPLEFTFYTNSDYSRCKDTRKSVSGSLLTANDAPALQILKYEQHIIFIHVRFNAPESAEISPSSVDECMVPRYRAIVDGSGIYLGGFRGTKPDVYVKPGR